MAQIIVRNLGAGVVGHLKRRAKVHDRSLEAEVRMILNAAANQPSPDWESARKGLAALRKSLSGRKFPRTIDLIREGRR